MVVRRRDCFGSGVEGLEGRVREVVGSAKGGLHRVASHRALALSLHLRDREGGGWRDLSGRCLGCRRSGRRGIRRGQVGLLWRICRRRLCLRGPADV